MIFTFWTEPNHAGASRIDSPPGIREWSAKFRDFRVFDDKDAIVALAEIGSDLPEIYKRIRIPACRSDLARLALLYRHGGLYTDAHSGVGNPLRIAETMAMLASYELILFDGRCASNSPNASHFANTSIAACKRSSLLRSAIDLIVEKLKRHRLAESLSSDYVEYNIANITGVWPLIQTFCSHNGKEYAVRSDLEDRVGVVVLDENMESYPVFWYRHYNYRQKSSHWSERQKSERLFDENLDVSAGVDLSKLVLNNSWKKEQIPVDNLSAVHEAEFLLNLNAPSQALAALAPAIKTHPDNYWVNYVSGRLMKALNLEDISHAFYSRAIASGDPSRIGSVYQLVKDRMYVGEYDNLVMLNTVINETNETDHTRDHINKVKFLRAISLLNVGDISGFNDDLVCINQIDFKEREIRGLITSDMLVILKSYGDDIAQLSSKIGSEFIDL